MIEIIFLAYNTNFEIKYVDDQQIYDLSLLKGLGQDILDNYSTILLTLEAIKPGVLEHTFANVLVTLPEKLIDVLPTFSKSFYTGNYTKTDEKDELEILGSPITITSDYSDDTIVTVIESALPKIQL